MTLHRDHASLLFFYYFFLFESANVAIYLNA